MAEGRREVKTIECRSAAAAAATAAAVCSVASVQCTFLCD